MLFQREFKTMWESECWDEVIKFHLKPGSVKGGNKLWPIIFSAAKNTFVFLPDKCLEVNM